MDSFTGSSKNQQGIVSVAAKCNLCVPGSAAVNRLVYHVLDSVIAVAMLVKKFLVTFLSLFEFHYFFVLNKLISTISEKKQTITQSQHTHTHTHTHAHTHTHKNNLEKSRFLNSRTYLY